MRHGLTNDGFAPVAVAGYGRAPLLSFRALLPDLREG